MSKQFETCEVPLVEQLESVPADGRLVIDHSDGMGTTYIPVGRMSHDAAAELRRLHELCQELLAELYVYRASEYLKDVTAAIKTRKTNDQTDNP